MLYWKSDLPLQPQDDSSIEEHASVAAMLASWRDELDRFGYLHLCSPEEVPTLDLEAAAIYYSSLTGNHDNFGGETVCGPIPGSEEFSELVYGFRLGVSFESIPDAVRTISDYMVASGVSPLMYDVEEYVRDYAVYVRRPDLGDVPTAMANAIKDRTAEDDSIWCPCPLALSDPSSCDSEDVIALARITQSDLFWNGIVEFLRTIDVWVRPVSAHPLLGWKKVTVSTLADIMRALGAEDIPLGHPSSPHASPESALVMAQRLGLQVRAADGNEDESGKLRWDIRPEF